MEVVDVPAGSVVSCGDWPESPPQRVNPHVGNMHMRLDQENQVQAQAGT